MYYESDGGTALLNNTVINRFMTPSFKRSADADSPPYEAPVELRNSGEFLSLDCSGVQGDHEVVWETDNLVVGDRNGTVNCDANIRPNSQLIMTNYSSR